MLLIDNIGRLLTLSRALSSPLGEIVDAAILLDQEKIVWRGEKDRLPKVNIDKCIDARGCLVMPGLIDCHSHLIFAGSRKEEFARRMNNETYQEIMAKGGGIMSTVEATRKASDEDLFSLATTRADQILANGVTTLEVKSGYGLSNHDEIRSLRLIKQLAFSHPLDFHPTFLGAHVVPKDFAHDRKSYIDLVINDMLPKIATENLAIDCDVFCETGAFSFVEARQILSRAHELGLGLRAHVQQLSHNNGMLLVKELPIKSISHADYLSDEDINLLAHSHTVVEALPFAALFLRSQQMTPVASLIKAGVPVAIACDFNPGSAMCNDLVLAARLGMTYYGLTINDAIRAITVNAASALQRHDIGAIDAGFIGDVIITNSQDVDEIFYDWTKPIANMVIKRGSLIAERGIVTVRSTKSDRF